MSDEKPKITSEQLIAKLKGLDQDQPAKLGEVVALMEMMDGHLRALSVTALRVEKNDQKLNAVANKVYQTYARVLLVENAMQRITSRN